MNQALKAITSEAAEINSRAAGLNSHRAELTERINAITTDRDARSIESAEARKALADAFASNDADAITEARKRVASASAKATEGDDVEIELQALQAAISSIEDDLAVMTQEMRTLAEREKALLLVRVRELAEDIPLQQKQAVETNCAVFAKAAALSKIASDAGGGPTQFGPMVLPAMLVQAVGTNWSERAAIRIDPTPMIESSRLDALAVLRAEGFRV